MIRILLPKVLLPATTALGTMDPLGREKGLQAVKNGRKPAEKQHRPPERQSVRNRLRQLQEEGKQNAQPKQRKKSQDRDR